MNTNKHAYLIMAYNNWNQLSILLKLLDDSRNDIFVHIDANSGTYPQKMLAGSVSQSEIVFIPRKKVFWADYSQADVEMDLMEAARSRNSYHYYHLLSGMCLPIKTQDEIHRFFENETHDFIAMTPNGGNYVEKHTRYYHFALHNRFYRHCKPLKAIDRAFMYSQRILGLKRKYEKDLLISTGWQWFSITDNFCEYVLESRNCIEKIFKHTIDADEKFLGTMINKIGDYNRLYRVVKPGEGNLELQYGCQRLIDWERGQPYVWGSGKDSTEKDYQELISSDYYFARKFDEKVNLDIILKIAQHLKPDLFT